MDEFTVPCDECTKHRAAFEAEGYIVFGCQPHASKQGMCVLQYEHRSAIKAKTQASAEGAPVAAAAKTSKSKVTVAPSADAAAPFTSAASDLKRHVNLKALNLRSTPSATSSANVLRTLVLSQSVEIIGDEQHGWWPVELPGGSERGFVKARIDDENGIGTPSLRLSATPAREALVTEAIRQWERFKFGQGKETVDPFFKLIGEMWAAIKLPHDGRDDIPWSAAAISFMVRQAAANHAGYKKFKSAASHSKYIHAAITEVGQADAPFHGFRLFEHKPQLGDLVARSREDVITFERAAGSDAFKSHTDIIVAVHADAVYAIGGNVSHSVSVTRYPKTDSGQLSDAGGVFALLVNNA
jgi:hypothetical protein